MTEIETALAVLNGEISISVSGDGVTGPFPVISDEEIMDQYPGYHRKRRLPDGDRLIAQGTDQYEQVIEVLERAASEGSSLPAETADKLYSLRKHVIDKHRRLGNFAAKDQLESNVR